MSKSTEKIILVLANSIKKGGRCVAGLEAEQVSPHKYKFGTWVRPIDADEDEGTIPNARTIVSGRRIRTLDLVSIRFWDGEEDPFHPEDRVIDGNAEWKVVGRVGKKVLANRSDQSGDLWGADSATTRRVLPRAGADTLRIVKPEGECFVTAFREDTPWGTKHRRYLHLLSGGITHQFSIDDPDFSLRHDLSPSALADREVRIDLDPKKTVVVVSLTKPFQGFQYKIAATIFEL